MGCTGWYRVCRVAWGGDACRMVCGTMWCPAGGCSAVPCSAVWCRAMQHGAVPCRAVPCSTGLCSAVPCSTGLCSAMLCSLVQCRAVPCHELLVFAPWSCVAQRGAVQCHMVQCSEVWVIQLGQHRSCPGLFPHGVWVLVPPWVLVTSLGVPPCPTLLPLCCRRGAVGRVVPVGALQRFLRWGRAAPPAGLPPSRGVPGAGPTEQDLQHPRVSG